MPYIPVTEKQKLRMLKTIGFNNIQELLENIDSELVKPRTWNLPPGLSEQQLVNHLEVIKKMNLDLTTLQCYAGGGIYDHYIPAAVDHLVSRPEFYTAYTPYQAEVSQGTLQSIFEYQSMIAELTGMDVANASMYDGATAFAEALIMSAKITKKNKILIADSIHPHDADVINTYLQFQYSVQQIPHSEKGILDANDLKNLIDDNTAAVGIASPNFFGNLENLSNLIDLIHDHHALAVIKVNPLSLSILTPPGHLNADIVVGEGQTLGLNPNFGGPLLGIFAVKRDYLRHMPGRIIGETVDAQGRTGYVMTLQTREQHIKRERATSNICTNQALCALTSTVYMALLGRSGLETAARNSLILAHQLQQELTEIPGVSLKFNSDYFNEFVVELPCSADLIVNSMIGENILGGISLGKYNRDWQNLLMIAVTEKRTPQDLKHYVDVFKQCLNTYI
ncbi:MAG: aminomethyl-transferring glycine dehydrogenase subunit GcvPA [bacterium]